MLYLSSPIHKHYHTIMPMEWPCKELACPSRATLGQVSCSRTMWKERARDLTSNPEISGSEPQCHFCTKRTFFHFSIPTFLSDSPFFKKRVKIDVFVILHILLSSSRQSTHNFNNRKSGQRLECVFPGAAYVALAVKSVRTLHSNSSPSGLFHFLNCLLLRATRSLRLQKLKKCFSFSIVLVENIPDDLALHMDVRPHLPLSAGFHTLLDQAKHSVEVVSPVWALNPWDPETTPSTAKQVRSHGRPPEHIPPHAPAQREPAAFPWCSVRGNAIIFK